ncbi:hypothetical protein MNBD_GAMMA22-519 [hydrothermal vent metagenome]|uniref:Outer membrane protein n=1 Tax=hydrothermal vent metagenome TaxID=652676 RepID=A0A3B0ZML0_9ZZZZ
MKLKYLLITPLLFVFPIQAYADAIGVYLGAGSWNHSASGYVSDSSLNIDLKDDLNLKDNQEGYFYIAIEHPVPIIPNIKFASTKLGHQGNGIMTQSVSFGGQTFNISDPVASTIVLDSTDITAYYEILDNVVELDLGLTARKLDGKIRIVSTAVTGEELINQTVPMIYAAVAFNLPAGITLNGESNFISAGGVTYTDLMVKLRYEIVSVFGVEGGIRTQKLSLKDIDNVTADVTFSGPFIGAFLHF